MRVLVADDNDDVLRDIRDLLEPEFDVIGTVGDGNSLVSAAEEFKPDVIIADISMPDLSGIEAAAKILEINPDSRIVLLTAHNDSALVDEGMAVGALGYVIKLNAGEDLARAINEAVRGRRFLSSVIRAGQAKPSA